MRTSPMIEDVYGLLSEMAPTLVIDLSGMEWQELALVLAEESFRLDRYSAEMTAARIAEALG